MKCVFQHQDFKQIIMSNFNILEVVYKMNGRGSMPYAHIWGLLNLYEWAGKKQFVTLKLECQSGVRIRDLLLFKQTALTTTTPGPRFANVRFHIK